MVVENKNSQNAEVILEPNPNQSQYEQGFQNQQDASKKVNRLIYIEKKFYVFISYILMLSFACKTLCRKLSIDLWQKKKTGTDNIYGGRKSKMARKFWNSKKFTLRFYIVASTIHTVVNNKNKKKRHINLQQSMLLKMKMKLYISFNFAISFRHTILTSKIILGGSKT